MNIVTVSYELADLLALLNSSNTFSGDLIRALRFFEEHNVEVSEERVIFIPTDLVSEALQNFGSAIRHNGSAEASDGFSAYKFAGHCQKQIAESTERLQH